MAADLERHLLEARDLRVVYGGVVALSEAGLQIASGEVVGLIGPNGAGKTSLLNAVSGVAKLAAGSILLDGRELAGLPAHAVARAGVVRTYQNVRLFRTLSVEANVTAGTFAARTAPDAAHIDRLFAMTGLEETDRAARAGSLAYGVQRRLEIARALASRPLMLLLDEPAAGLNPEETERLGGLIRAIAASGVGILLVEHDMQLVSDVCDRVTVLNFGSAIAHGTPSVIASDPAVIEAYLGSPR